MDNPLLFKQPDRPMREEINYGLESNPVQRGQLPVDNSMISLVKQFEGFRETPYWDVNALRTGYGSDTVTTADGRVVPVTKETRVTREDADRDLARRVQTEFVPRAASAVGQEAFSRLNPAQRAALVSITYNYGSLPGSVADAVRTGDSGAVSAAIRALGSHNGGVNADRRNQEAAIFAGEADMPSDGRDHQDPRRLAHAYANGKMTPEDEKLYEQGVADGEFPPVEKPRAAGLDSYAASVAQRAAATRAAAMNFQPINFGGAPAMRG